MSKLLGLSKFCGELNIGGLLKIEYKPTVDIDASTYDPIISAANNWQKEIQFLDGGTWLTAYVLPSKKQWKEAPQKSKQLPYYTQRINAIIPNLKPSVTGELERMTDYQYLLKVTDANGQPWLIGSLEHPATFAGSAESGNGNGDLKHYKISFECKTPNRAHGYSPVL